MGYVNELKRLSRNCKFENTLQENMRDQLVCGIRSDVIRQRLFAESDDLTYTQAVTIATSLEAAERDAAAVEPTSAGSGATGQSSAVHALAPWVGQRNAHASGGAGSARAGPQRAAGGARSARAGQR